DERQDAPAVADQGGDQRPTVPPDRGHTASSAARCAHHRGAPHKPHRRWRAVRRHPVDPARGGNEARLHHAHRGIVRGASLLRIAMLALLWGSGFLWTKLALRGLGPELVVVIRLILAAMVLTVAVRLVGGRLPAGGTTWFHLGHAAAFGNVIPYLPFSVGLQQVDSAVGGMLNATTPMWTAIIAIAATRRHQPSATSLIGVVVGLVGAVVIFAPWNAGSQFTSAGALACLLGAFSYAVGYVYIARYLADRGMTPLALSAGQLAVAAGLSLPLALLLGTDAPTWRTDAVLSMLVLGILGTGAAYVLNYRIIADDGPVAGSAVVYLLPVVAIA